MGTISDMSTRERSPFCPDCAIPLNQPEPVAAPRLLGGFGFSSEQISRKCPECGARLVWLPTEVGSGSWIAGSAPKPLRSSPAKKGTRVRSLKLAEKAAGPAEPSKRQMSDPILSVAEVAASTPWSEAALEELARAPGSPFREKAGILVARESEIHAWIDSDDGAERPEAKSSRPRLAG